MLIEFFLKLKEYKFPVSIIEFLSFLETLNHDLVKYDIDKFYYLSKTSLIKDEKLFDKFDIIFGQYFKSIEQISLDDIFETLSIPKEWLKKILKDCFQKKN